MTKAQDVRTMQGLAQRLEEALDAADRIDAMTAIRLDEALQQVRRWLDRHATASDA